jgi:hypothetical protein
MVIETRHIHTTLNAKMMFYINNLFDQIEKNKIGGVCSTYEERRGAYRDVVGKLEG